MWGEYQEQKACSFQFYSTFRLIFVHVHLKNTNAFNIYILEPYIDCSKQADLFLENTSVTHNQWKFLEMFRRLVFLYISCRHSHLRIKDLHAYYFLVRTR